MTDRIPVEPPVADDGLTPQPRRTNRTTTVPDSQGLGETLQINEPASAPPSVPEQGDDTATLASAYALDQGPLAGVETTPPRARRQRVAEISPPITTPDAAVAFQAPPPPLAPRLDEIYRLAQADRQTQEALDWLMRQTGGPLPPQGQPAAAASTAAGLQQDQPGAAVDYNDPSAPHMTGDPAVWSAIGRNVRAVPGNLWNIAAGGALRAVQSTLDLPQQATLRDLAGMVDRAALWLNENVADTRHDQSTPLGQASPTPLQDVLTPFARQYIPLPAEGVGTFLLPERGGMFSSTMNIPDADAAGNATTDNMLSQFLQGVVQFASGYGAAGRVTGLDNRFWNAFHKATITDFSAFQGSDANFADLMEYFGLRNAATEWLTNKIPDEEFQNRMRNALAGAPLNLLLPTMFHLAARQRNKQVLQQLTGAESMDEAGHMLQQAGVDQPTLRAMLNYGVPEALREANIAPEQFQVMLASLRAPRAPARRPGTGEPTPPAPDAPPGALDTPPPIPDAAPAPGAPPAELSETLRRLREAGERLDRRAGEPERFEPDELVRSIERRMPERLDPGIPDHTFARYMWDNISRGEWERPAPVDRSGEYRPTPLPSDAPPANLGMVRLTADEEDLLMRALQTRTRWYEEGATVPRSLFGTFDRTAVQEAHAAVAKAEGELRRRLGAGTAHALLDDVVARMRAGDPAHQQSYDAILRYVRERYGMAEPDGTPRRQDIRRNTGGDDWLEEHWAAMSRRATAGEVSAYYRGDEGVRVARARQPVARSAVEASADHLEQQLRTFENGLAGKSPAEKSAAIRRQFGFYVDPERLRTGNVWWRVGPAGEFQAAAAGGDTRAGGGHRGFWADLSEDRRAAFAEMWSSKNVTTHDLISFVKEHTGRDVTPAAIKSFGLRNRQLFEQRRFAGWTPERLEEFRKLWNEGKSVETIGEHFRRNGLGVSDTVLYRTLHSRPEVFVAAERKSPRAGLLDRLPADQRAQLREMWNRVETTMPEMQAFVEKGIGTRPSTSMLAKLGEAHPEEFPARGASRIDWTEPRLAELERLWHRGDSYETIAARFHEFGVDLSPSTIRRIAFESPERFPARGQPFSNAARALLEHPRLMALDDAAAARALSESLGQPFQTLGVTIARKRYGLTLTPEERASLQQAIEPGGRDVRRNVIAGLTEGDARAEARLAMARDEPFELPPDVPRYVVDALEPMRDLVPAGWDVGVLLKVEPTGQADGLVRVLYQLLDGRERGFTLPKSVVYDPAWAWRPDRLTNRLQDIGDNRFIGINRFSRPLAADLEPAVPLGRGNPVAQHLNVVRADLAHEITHAVWHSIDPALRLRLIAHADRHGILDISGQTWARLTGFEHIAADLDPSVTRADLYAVHYARLPNPASALQEEAVAHMVQLAHLGALPKAVMHEITGDLEALFATAIGRSSAAAGTPQLRLDPSRMGGIPPRAGMGGRGPQIMFSAASDLPVRLARAPTWDDVQARLPKDVDGHADVEHLQRRVAEVTGKSDWAALTVAEKVEVYRDLGSERAARTGFDGPPLKPEEIDSLVSMYTYVRDVHGRQRPQSLADWVRNQGGVKDESTDIRHLMGGARARPGLINNERGVNPDDMALRAWERGYFPEHTERPTINEFLDALREDLHTGRVVRASDRDHFEDVRVADEMAEDLADYGITSRHFRTADAVRDHFSGRRVGASERAGNEGMATAQAIEGGEATGAGRGASGPGDVGAPPAAPPGGQPPPLPPVGGGRPPPLPPSGGPPGGPPSLPGQPFSREFDFNWDRMATSDDVKRAAGMMIDAHRQVMIDQGVSGGGRGYVQTHEMTEAMARNKNGLRLIFEDAARSGRIFDAAETRALTQYKVSAWEELVRRTEIAAQPNSSPEDFVRMRHMGQLSILITSEIKGSISEAARSMNILRRAAGSDETYRAQLRAIVEQAGGEDTNRALAVALRDILDGPDGGTRADAMLQKGLLAKTVDAIIEFRAANLLTGPITWIRNITSNTFAVPYQILVRKVAEHIGSVLHPVDGVKLGEAAQMAAAMRGHWREAFSALGESFVTGESRFGTTGTHMGTAGPGTGRPSRLGAEAWGVPTPPTWRNATAHPWGDPTAAPGPMAPNDLRRVGTLVRPQLYREIWQQPTSALGLGMDLLANAFQAISFRPTGAPDPLFKVLNRQAQLGALAVRRAEEQLIRGEITQAQLKDRVLELRRDPTEDMRLEAQSFADYNTFTDEMGRFGMWVEQARQSDSLGVRLIANMLLPFHRTPNRLFAYAFENSPLALVTSKFHAEMQAGGARADLALAKLSVGTMGLTLGMDLYLDGWITGSAPQRRGERETYQRGGFREYALKVPTSETDAQGNPVFVFLPLNNLGAGFDVLLWGAMLGDTQHQMSMQNSGTGDTLLEHWDQAAAAATFAVAEMMMNKSVLQGVGNTMKAMVQRETRAQNYMEQMTQSFMPAASGMRYARRTGVPGVTEGDTIRRHVNGMLEALMDITPGISTSLPPLLDFWGRERTSASGLGPWYDAMAPFFPTTTSANAQPIDREFVRLNFFPEHPARVPILRSERAQAIADGFEARRPRSKNSPRGEQRLLAAQPDDPVLGESNMVTLRGMPRAINRLITLTAATPAGTLATDNTDALVMSDKASVLTRLIMYGDQTLLQVLNALVTNNTEYRAARDDQRIETIRDVIQDYRTAAMAQVIRQEPDIQQRRDRMPSRESQAKRAPF